MAKKTTQNSMQMKKEIQQAYCKADVMRWQAFGKQKPNDGQCFVARLSNGDWVPPLIWSEPLAWWFDEDDEWALLPAIA